MLSDVSTPALIIPIDGAKRASGPLLAVGRGDETIGIDIGEGHGFLPISGPGLRGIAIEDIEIELDPASSFDLQERSAPAGAMVRTASRLEIVSGTERGAACQRYLVLNGLPGGSEGLDVGFTRWRLVVMRDEKVVFEVWVDVGADLDC